MNLGALTERYERRLETIARGTCVELSTRLQARTPIDTGRARASWTPAINGFNRSNAGGSFQGTASRLNAGDSYTCTSTLSYIRRLEYGYSSQAPNGMLRITAAEFDSIVNGQIRAAGGG